MVVGEQGLNPPCEAPWYAVWGDKIYEEELITGVPIGRLEQPGACHIAICGFVSEIGPGQEGRQVTIGVPLEVPLSQPKRRR